MGKTIIAAVVGALILFIWQFLSWNTLRVHQSEMEYTANQEKVMTALSENLTEGTYFIPNMPPGASTEDQEKLHKDAVGKPWATVSYHNAFDASMGMNMFRGFVTNLMVMLLLIWLLQKIPGLSMTTVILVCLAVGAMGYLSFPYLNSIWFENDTMGYIIDTVVQWGLVGAWLGWFLNRNKSQA